MPAGRNIVFIVDRDQPVRESLRFVVELDGMDVRTCTSAAELLAHPEFGLRCCAIVDGGTLDLDGQEVLNRLEDALGILPIALVTDHVSRRLLAPTIKAGLFHLIEKPVLDDALLRWIRAVR